MNETKHHYIFAVGQMPEKGAKVIQKAYRRYKFKLKIARIRNTYEVYMVMKEEARYQDLKNKIHNLSCMSIVKSTKTEVLKARKLDLIRKNLAKMCIKRIFKEKRWKINVIIEKIKRYKRRRRAAIKRKIQKKQELLIAKFGDQADLSSLKDLNFDNISINSEEDFETTTSDREALEKARFLKELEEERKLKIRFGRISYNCPEPQFSKIVTYFEKKEIPFSTGTSPLPKLEQKILKRVEKKKEFKKNKKDFDEPSYMKSTFSFSVHTGEFKDESEELPEIKVKKLRGISTLMYPTQASVLKINFRSSSVEKHLERDTFLGSPTNAKVSKSPLLTKPKLTTYKKASECNFSTFLPDISTRHSILPKKLKSRVCIMKGFTNRKPKGPLNFSIY